jgi:hypothetical protein
MLHVHKTVINICIIHVIFLVHSAVIIEVTVF